MGDGSGHKTRPGLRGPLGGELFEGLVLWIWYFG